jgi:hypothetical protein
VFTTTSGPDATVPRRLNVVTTRTRAEVLAALRSAEPEGFTASRWQDVACERAEIGRTTFFDIRRALYVEGYVGYASKIYRLTPSGERWLAEQSQEGGNGSGY